MDIILSLTILRIAKTHLSNRKRNDVVKTKIKEKVLKVITINGCNKINPNRLIINGISLWKQETLKLRQICGEHKIWKFRPVSLAGAIQKKINK